MIAANLRWLKLFSHQPCTLSTSWGMPSSWKMGCLCAAWLNYYINILQFSLISSSLWVSLFYRKALQWFTMKVIFLVSLLQKSNKYKSNAIWVLQTLSFHFILFVSFTSLFSFKPQVEIFISWMQSRLKPLPEHTGLLCSGSCDAGHLCLQWAEFRLPNKTTSEQAQLWPTWQDLHID